MKTPGVHASVRCKGLQQTLASVQPIRRQIYSLLRENLYQWCQSNDWMKEEGNASDLLMLRSVDKLRSYYFAQKVSMSLSLSLPPTPFLLSLFCLSVSQFYFTQEISFELHEGTIILYGLFILHTMSVCLSFCMSMAGLGNNRKSRRRAGS